MSAPDSSEERTREQRRLALTTQRSIVGTHVELRKGRFWRDSREMGEVFGGMDAAVAVMAEVWRCGGGGGGGVEWWGELQKVETDPSTSGAGTLALQLT